MKTSKAFTLIELLVVMAILAILAGIMLPACGKLIGGGNYSEGSRVGVIQKLSKKGNFNKSYEGELALTSTSSTSDGEGHVRLSNVWAFSIPGSRTQLVEAQKAMDDGARVRLEYEQVRIRNAFDSDTDYLLKKVVRLDNTR